MRTDRNLVIEAPFDPMNVPPISGIATDPCGDKIGIYLRVKHGQIIEANPRSGSSDISFACVMMLTQMIREKALDEARHISEEDLIEALGGLPVKHRHWAKTTVRALENAIQNYENSG